MRKLIQHYQSLAPEARRGLVVIGLITLAMLAFALLTLEDLLHPADTSELISNLVPPLVLLGCIASLVLCWLDRPTAAAWVSIFVVLAGMLILPFVTVTQTFSLVAAAIAFAIPVLIAFQMLPPQQLTIAFLIAVLTGAAILVADSFETQRTLSMVESPEAVIGSILATITILLVAYYTLRQFARFPFQTKVVLTVAFLGIIPTLMLAVINNSTLSRVLTDRAIASLDSTTTRSAMAIEDFISGTLHRLAVEAKIPDFSRYLSLPASERAYSQEGVDALSTLTALRDQDPANIRAYSLLDPRGRVILSTNRELQDQIWSDRPEISTALSGSADVGKVRVNDSGATLSFAMPLFNQEGVQTGLLVVDYQADILQQIATRDAEAIGQGISIILLDDSFVILANTDQPETRFRLAARVSDTELLELIRTQRIPLSAPDQLYFELPTLTAQLDALGDTTSIFPSESHANLAETEQHIEEAGVRRIALPNGGSLYLAAFQPTNILLGSANLQIRNSLLIGVVIGLAGILLALIAAQALGKPVRELTAVAEQVAAGDLNAKSEIDTQDEIGSLARAFNAMTSQVQSLVASLEQRVADRTASLSRRAGQIRAAAEVGAAAAALRDTNTLLNEATYLISSRFGYYHVGIFLIDERGEYAELRTANSEGGQRMLERGHKLKVGETGIVGYVTARGEARIALDVGDDAVFFDNPDLPETRSEMAIPLRIGTRIIGALDVQSKDPSAFTEDDVATLRVLADQIAVAIENARLLSESRAALQAERRAYGELSRIAWERMARSAEMQGYIGTEHGEIAPIDDRSWPAGMQEAVTVGETRLDRKTNNLHIPLKVRGVTIGAIRLQKPEQAAWTESELVTVETLSEQLGIALDSARQYRETQERADRERQINLLAGEVRSAISTESILQNTVRELGKALGATRAFIQLGSLDDGADAGKAE